MISGWELWLVLVGIAIGAAVVFVALVRLPRAEDDVGDMERRSEATWIANAIERGGGVAPPSFVEEVLELHQAYLNEPRVPLPQGAGAPPLPPFPPMAPPSQTTPGPPMGPPGTRSPSPDPLSSPWQPPRRR